MIKVNCIETKKGKAITIDIEVPKARLLLIRANKGFIMCAALNIRILDELHPERCIVAATVKGVKSIEEMLEKKINEATLEAQKLGINPGEISGREALEKMM